MRNTIVRVPKRYHETATVTNNTARFEPLMHEAKTVGIFRSVRFLGENTIGQFFGEVSEICDGCTAAVYEKKLETKAQGSTIPTCLQARWHGRQ